MQLHACLRLSEEVSTDLAEALRADLDNSSEVDWQPPELWRVRLLGFGHVTRGDAVRLAETLRDRLAGAAPMTLRLSGVEPLPFDGDDCIWAHLAGDVDAVASLAAAMPRWVHQLGFVPDRRAFRPAVRLGRITARTQLSYLESLQARLGDYAGPAWTAHAVTIASTRAATLERPEVLDVFDTAPIGDAAAASPLIPPRRLRAL